MANEPFFRSSWQITKPQSSRAYPRERWVTIGLDPHLANRYVAAWLDADGILHVFRELKLSKDGKKLTGPAKEVGPDKQWTVTIERVGDNIQGTVAEPSGVKKRSAIREASLAGTWGADAPPPFTDDDPRP